VTEVTIKEEVVTKTLKTSVAALIDLNINKNLIGSAMAGSIGKYSFVHSFVSLLKYTLTTLFFEFKL